MSDAPALPQRQQRLRAVGLTSLALGVALGSAWAVSETRSTPLPLGDRITLKDWPISLRLPQGWKHEVDEADRWTGQLTARPRDADAMRLIVKHTRAHAGGEPIGVAEQFLTERFADPTATSASAEEMAVGPVRGVRVLLEVETDSGSRSVELAVASLPSGPAIILMVISPSSRSARLHRTLRSVCDSIEFVNPRLGPSADSLAAEIGLSCPTPPGALCVEANDIHRPVAAFLADAKSDSNWFAEVWRTMLVEPRTLEDLAFDSAIAGSLRLDTESQPQHIEIAGHPAAFIESEEFERFQSTWAIDLGGGVVAMIRARGSDSARETIQSACRTIATGVQPREPKDPFNAAAAAKLGGAVVQDLRRRGLAAIWPTADGTDWYLLRRFGEARGYHRDHHERHSTTRPAGESVDEFVGATETEIHYSDDVRQIMTASWTSDAAADSFESESNIAVVTAGLTRRLESRVRREPGKNDMQITVESGGKSKTATVGIGENFVPEPLENAALQSFARMDAGREMITLETSPRARRPAAVFSRLDPSADGASRDVWQWNDYSADRQRYVLDKSGAFERIVVEEGVELVRSDRARLSRALGWFREDR